MALKHYLHTLTKGKRV